MISLNNTATIDMRVAVCVSGACSVDAGDLIKSNDMLTSKFPQADFYYATWEQFKPDFEQLFPHYRCEYFPEPEMHYHPYTGIKKETSPAYRRTTKWVTSNCHDDWTSHHTKQILIHSWLVNKLKNNYDVIVRTRYDAVVSEHADFLPYLEDTFRNHRANCFAVAGTQTIDDNPKFQSYVPPAEKGWDERFLDFLIIHNFESINNDVVNLLHKESKLQAAEFGWYQVLKTDTQHRNHFSWVDR